LVSGSKELPNLLGEFITFFLDETCNCIFVRGGTDNCIVDKVCNNNIQESICGDENEEEKEKKKAKQGKEDDDDDRDGKTSPEDSRSSKSGSTNRTSGKSSSKSSKKKG